MNITIQGPQGDFDIELPPRSTIEDLKDAIVQKKSYDKEKLNLRAGENDLLVNDLLDSVGVKDGSIVTLTFEKPSTRSYVKPQPWRQDQNTTIPAINGYGMNGGGTGPAHTQPPRSEPLIVDPETARKINKLVSMGFDKGQAEVAIRKAKGVVQVAASFLPLSEDEMKSNPIPRPPPPVPDPQRDAIGKGRQDDIYIPDEPVDEVLRKEMLDLLFDPVSKEAIEIVLREVAPNELTRLGGDFLTELAEGALRTKKYMRVLKPEQKQAVKQLRSFGLPDDLSISALSQARWDVNAAIQILQAKFSGAQRNQVTGQGARANVRPQVVTGMPGTNAVPVRNPTEGTRLSGAGVRQSEQVNRPNLGTTLDEVREAAEYSLDNEQTEQVRIQSNRIEDELY